MNAAAKNLTDLLDKEGIKYSTDERENDTVLTCGAGLKNTSVKLNVFIDNNNTHVALRCFGFIRVSQDKFANALITCNTCNQEYRWVKFTIDEDMDINAQDDAIVSAETAGTEIWELMRRMFNIVDECYPVFMKSIWA